MATTLLSFAVVAVACLSLAGWMWVSRARRRWPQGRGAGWTAVTPAAGPAAAGVGVGADVIVAAPTVRVGRVDVPLGGWLRESGPGGWTELARELYAAAARDPGVARYFAGLDERSMAVLQRHFVRVLVQVTSRGLTRGDVEALRRAHAGRGVTGDAYDRVIGVLARLLVARRVPDDAVGGVALLAAALRPAVVDT